MEIKGVTVAAFEDVVMIVSRARYEDNVVCEWMKYGNRSRPTPLNRAGTRFKGRVVVRDSHGAGARTSWSGRHGPNACWHAFRDVIAALFADHPDATVRTMLARYDASNFARVYPPTGLIDVGRSMTMPELCQCSDPDNGHRVPDEIQSGTDDRLASRLDAVGSMKPGECGWCSRSTMGDASMWCSQDCQEQWQDKYRI